MDILIKIMEVATYTFWALSVICGVWLLYKVVQACFAYAKPKGFPEAKINHKYGVLLPARNESKVIRGLLDSIKASDYPEELLDVFVIVADEKDPTVEICKEYKNITVYVKPESFPKTKGGTLDYAIKEILKTKKENGYEAFFVFDADNIIEPTFFTEMNKAFDAGYDLAIGYRNSKNWNDNWISVCSGLTFTMINGAGNKFKNYAKMNLTFSGTGLYLRASILENAGGWPFQTLTEDYEMSMYALLNNMRTAYVEKAEFYDEQPITFKNSWNQRKRWLKGFDQVNKKYRKSLYKSTFTDKKNLASKIEYTIGVIPMILFIATMVLYAILLMVATIVSACYHSSLWSHYLLLFVLLCTIFYVIFAVYSMLLGLSEKKKTNISTKSIIIGTFMNPIFLAFYIPLFISAKTKKEVEWVPIARKEGISYNEMKSGENVEKKK